MTVVKGEVDITTYAYNGLVVMTFRCIGNNDAALRCAEREVQYVKDFKGLKLEAHIFEGEESKDIIYSLSWFKAVD